MCCTVVGAPDQTRSTGIDAIRTWVEEGRAPERLVASKLDANGIATMTRPICPYPQVAVYDGQGDPNTDASFACVNPQ